MPPYRKASLVLLALLLPLCAAAQAPSPPDLVPPLVAAQDGTPEGWRLVTFPRIPNATRYAVTEEQGRAVLQADADHAAAMIVWAQPFDPHAYPLLSWAWRVAGPLPGSDLHHKDGDDAAARVMILFPEDANAPHAGESWLRRIYRALYGDNLPTRGMAYVAATAPPSPVPAPGPQHGRHHKRKAHAAPDPWMPSAYTRHMMLLPLLPAVAAPAAETPPGWQHFQRDLEADYRAAFHDALPARALLAIMVDTDNTGQHATSAFTDLRLGPRPAGH